MNTDIPDLIAGALGWVGGTLFTVAVIILWKVWV